MRPKFAGGRLSMPFEVIYTFEIYGRWVLRIGHWRHHSVPAKIHMRGEPICIKKGRLYFEISGFYE
jgi:hypothetical protein